MSDYRELTVWQKSIDLVVCVYKLTKDFPRDEQYGLISQMRRAAVSIPSNIAEGSRRRGKDLRNFFVIAFGSGSELETQFEVCRRLEYGNISIRLQAEKLLDEILRMLNKMTNDKYL
ncbi:MAG: four helix bundle protein [Patescibacteria group bacterium]